MNSQLRIAVLTSSRADYSIYFPLLKLIRDDSLFDLNIMAFGSHLSPTHGYTLDQILSDGFEVNHRIDSIVEGDSPEELSRTMGLTTMRFAEIWAKESFDLIFCLGDRLELFAAAISTIPFNLSLAHIHGGETTLGSIDNYFRHSLSIISEYHFTTTRTYQEKVIQLIGSSDNVYNVGALSIDNLQDLELQSIAEFNKEYHLDLGNPTILITFHPETVSYQKNEFHIEELIKSLRELEDYQLVITMPNLDTTALMVREKLLDFIETMPNAYGIESFGTIGYLSCMKHCTFLLGNTSSAFVEASYFPKPVVNIGNRQDGRIRTSNIIDCEIQSNQILKNIRSLESNPPELPVEQSYGNGHTAERIITILKKTIEPK